MISILKNWISVSIINVLNYRKTIYLLIDWYQPFKLLPVVMT